jgi:1-acyl-sn-glycerol-3-phosphate acyltransferase
MSELAPMREQVYTDPRPKEHFDRFHDRARTREPDSAYELVRVLTSRYSYAFLRARAIAVENVPGRGAVILAPNHFSFMDHFLMGAYIRRKVRFMAKSQLFKPGPMQFIYTHGGVFPVRRGARDEETFITARAILARGGAITMYCEGGRSRTGKVAEQAKRGIGRLALETGAPVVPIAIHGSSRIRNWKRLQFPKVTIQYGEAIRWEAIEDPTREQQQSVADQVLVEIRRLYAGLEEHGRKGIIRRVREQRRAERTHPNGAAVA